MRIREEMLSDQAVADNIHRRAFGDDEGSQLVKALRKTHRYRKPVNGAVVGSVLCPRSLLDAGFQVTKLPAYQEWMTGALVYRHEFRGTVGVGLR